MLQMISLNQSWALKQYGVFSFTVSEGEKSNVKWFLVLCDSWNFIIVHNCLFTSHDKIKQKSKQWEYFNPPEPFIVKVAKYIFIMFVHTRVCSFVLDIQTLLVWSSVSVNGFAVSHLHPAVWCNFYASPPLQYSTSISHTHARTRTHAHTPMHTSTHKPLPAPTPTPHRQTAHLRPVLSLPKKKIFHLSLLTHRDTLRSDLNMSQGDSSQNEMLLAQCLLLSKCWIWFWRAFRKSVI